MCGRYVATGDPGALIEEFEITDTSALPDQALTPDYNVAPTKQAYIVTGLAVTDEHEGQQAHGRSLRIARWGLVPSWAKDPSVGSRMINARSETVADKPAFRSAFARRRCLVPADGYYEWQGERGAKQPYFIHPKVHRPGSHERLAMAGLYEWWIDRTRAADDPLARRLTFTIITRAAAGPLARIHDRMPVMIQPDQWQAWLDEAERAQHVLDTWVGPELTADPVSTKVNHVRNNGADLIQPLALG